MINRIFFMQGIHSLVAISPVKEANVYDCIMADDLTEESLKKAYKFIEDSVYPMAMGLEIRELLTPEQIRNIAAFLFIPAYLRIAERPVILLSGSSQDGPELSAVPLRAYLVSQGIREPLIYLLQARPLQKEDSSTGSFPVNRLFHSLSGLSHYYTGILRTDQYYSNDIFLYVGEGNEREEALTVLQQAEKEFQRQFPRLFELMHIHLLLKEEHDLLCRRQDLLLAELANQRQYVDILRSGHQAKEIQDYYTREYEVLPLWYKRFGHLLKVFTGKRTFRSLFRDDVKKYKV